MVREEKPPRTLSVDCDRYRSPYSLVLPALMSRPAVRFRIAAVPPVPDTVPARAMPSVLVSRFKAWIVVLRGLGEAAAARGQGPAGDLDVGLDRDAARGPE